jgi:hypothetical protein
MKRNGKSSKQNSGKSLQIMFAQICEQVSMATPTNYREVIVPLFREDWERMIGNSILLFRTSPAYTRGRFELLDGSAAGTREFLAAMQFCLGY